MTGPVRRAALFFAGLAALLAAASVYYELRVRRGDFFRQVQWFMDPGVQPSVLFVGDSRLAANVLGSHLPAGFYNWSYPGETLRQSYLRVKYALETKPRLRYLVLGLDDLTLSEPRARQREVADHLLFADLADVLEVYPGSGRFLLRAAGLFHFPLVNAANRRRLGLALVEDATWLLTGEAAPQPTQFVDADIRFG